MRQVWDHAKGTDELQVPHSQKPQSSDVLGWPEYQSKCPLGLVTE